MPRGSSGSVRYLILRGATLRRTDLHRDSHGTVLGPYGVRDPHRPANTPASRDAAVRPARNDRRCCPGPLPPYLLVGPRRHLHVPGPIGTGRRGHVHGDRVGAARPRRPRGPVRGGHGRGLLLDPVVLERPGPEWLGEHWGGRDVRRRAHQRGGDGTVVPD